MHDFLSSGLKTSSRKTDQEVKLHLDDSIKLQGK